MKDDKNVSDLVSATYIGDKGPGNSPLARYCFIFAQRVKFTLSLSAPLSAHTASIGYTIGLRRMMRISRAINEEELERTVNWHFTLDGLEAANDRVLRLMDRLELSNLTRRLPDQLQTSSDGQKFEVRVDSLNANYWYKHFGKGQDVSVYTFRNERDLLNSYSKLHTLSRSAIRASSCRHRKKIKR